MIYHTGNSNEEILQKIKNKEISLAGNRLLKIYGLLNCNSGKKMKMKNRIFFSSAKEAINNGFRPCGHCMKNAYAEWKKSNDI